MEVCGTHTVALFRTGIRDGLPKNINMVSGPGCPVCVTPIETMEKAIGLACRKNTCLFCFGDMLKVPGSKESLESARANRNAQVHMMYSPLEALEYAEKNRDKDVVLFGVGFETTIPLFASVLMRANKLNNNNLYMLSEFKVIPPALEALLSTEDSGIDGFMLPGHVSAMIGADAYRFMSDRYGMPGVITGFEPVDMLQGISALLQMISNGKGEIRNEYTRVVSPQGNKTALGIIKTVFGGCDSVWRGLGTIPGSGLRLKNEFERFDAERLIDFEIGSVSEPKGCKCGEVIKGKCKPTDCGLYGTRCNPSEPVGPCMVSSEGTCAAYFKYGVKK